MLAKTALKLNLGSRDRNIPGFKNMDIDPHPGVDFVGDVSDLKQFADESVEEIFASNILEHFPHVKVPQVLSEWRRVLPPGGILYISVPDFARAVEIYRAVGLERFKESWVENFLCGDQVYPTAYHYAIFDFDRLRYLCLEAGFLSVSRVHEFAFADRNDCSFNRSTADGKPVSLNCVVTR